MHGATIRFVDLILVFYENRKKHKNTMSAIYIYIYIYRYRQLCFRKAGLSLTFIFLTVLHPVQKHTSLLSLQHDSATTLRGPE